MTLKNEIAKKRLLSLAGIVCFAVLCVLPITLSKTTTGYAEVMSVMAGDDVTDSLDITFDEESIESNTRTIDSESVLEEKIAIYPEFDFSKVEETAYLIENTNLKTQPYDDSENAIELAKYDEITLTGRNELTYWEVSYDNNTYYINSNALTTDKQTVENMQEEERITAEKAAEEAARKAEKERIEATYNTSWNGSKLTTGKGVNYGPSGKETYYNLNMNGVIRIMRSIGNYDEYWVRDDGVKMLGNYVMVAANLSVHPRGSLVECSLGIGIVCDTGSFASSNPYQLDIAVTW